MHPKNNTSVADTATLEVANDTTVIPEAAVNTRPTPQVPVITEVPKVPTPTGKDGQQVLGPRGVAGKLRWRYGSTRKIQEAVKSFRMRDPK